MKVIRNFAIATGAVAVLAAGSFALADEAKPQASQEQRPAARAQGEHRHGKQHMQSRHEGMQERHKQMNERMGERHAEHERNHGGHKPGARERHGKHDHS